jgi:hypothetical protein
MVRLGEIESLGSSLCIELIDVTGRPPTGSRRRARDLLEGSAESCDEEGGCLDDRRKLVVIEEDDPSRAHEVRKIEEVEEVRCCRVDQLRERCARASVRVSAGNTGT